VARLRTASRAHLSPFHPPCTYRSAANTSATASSDGSALAPLPFTPSYEFDNFVTTFEDPFSYSSRPFEPVTNQDVANDEASPQELDNKLLGFSDPTMHATIVDEAGAFADLSMTAELYGMFFVAEDVFGGENTGRPLELTCYRRNLWQCSGQITLPRVVNNVIDEQGRHIAITELSASITGLESIEGKTAEIITIPWKGATPQLEESKIAAAPPNLTLDLTTGREIDANRVSLPVSWKRLQFKHATANNGRRKGLQQHYVVQINLLGKTTTGEVIKIAEIQSGPVIVRGRSPRNFDSRKDVHLTGDKKLERRNTSSTDNPTPKTERDSLLASLPRYPTVSATSWHGLDVEACCFMLGLCSRSRLRLMLACSVERKRMGYTAGCASTHPEPAPGEAHGSLSHSSAPRPGLDGRQPYKQASSTHSQKLIFATAKSRGPHYSVAVRGRKESQQIKC
jgi:hypothetical protein